jgi:hypothetical protein
MKNSVSLTLAVILMIGLAPLVTASSHEEGNWTGWIADENCAKNYEKSASAGHVGCAKGCVKNGAKWALATKDGHFILAVDGASAEENLGREVKVKGKLDKESNTIKVSSIS